MMLLAIDPGPQASAWVEYDNGRLVSFGIGPNRELLRVIYGSEAAEFAVEMIASYGMSVGADVFETAVWSGRFIQTWAHYRRESTVRRVYRRDVKLTLCGSSRAKDANVRQALIDKFGPGKDKAIGRKAAPGPLYGVSSHVWSALAVAVTADEGERPAAREAA